MNYDSLKNLDLMITTKKHLLEAKLCLCSINDHVTTKSSTLGTAAHKCNIDTFNMKNLHSLQQNTKKLSSL